MTVRAYLDDMDDELFTLHLYGTWAEDNVAEVSTLSQKAHLLILLQFGDVDEHEIKIGDKPPTTIQDYLDTLLAFENLTALTLFERITWTERNVSSFPF